jgi:predicted TIM-barrel fold metal-dependent hydrolase
MARAAGGSNDPWAYKYLALAQELDIKNIHVHKGPTVYPLSADAFDVRDVDYAATDFPELNFIVEHVGLPRLDDFCWIATQESNVYAGLSVAMALSICARNISARSWPICCSGSAPTSSSSAAITPFGHPNG